MASCLNHLCKTDITGCSLPYLQLTQKDVFGPQLWQKGAVAAISTGSQCKTFPFQTGDCWQGDLRAPKLLSHPNPALLCGPASRACAQKGIPRASIDQQEEHGLKRHIWINVDESAWRNQLHSFKGQVINNMLSQEQAGKHSTKKLISKMSPWLPAMLQGSFFLQGSFGKLINLGKGIHFQDENFAFFFFLNFVLLWPKKLAFRGKKVWEKMSVSSIKNCWHSS